VPTASRLVTLRQRVSRYLGCGSDLGRVRRVLAGLGGRGADGRALAAHVAVAPNSAGGAGTGSLSAGRTVLVARIWVRSSGMVITG
jgi:hypothetical protein